MSAVDAANEALDDQVESLEDVLARHRREVRELDTKARFMLKAAKKGRGSEAEAEIKRLEAALKERHAAELSAAQAREEAAGAAGGEGASAAASDGEIEDPSTVTNATTATATATTSGLAPAVDPEALRREREEAERRAVEAKKLKNKRKKVADAALARDKKAERASEREEERVAIVQSAGPSLKQIEIDKFEALLAPENLKIVEVAADGHCLYRSVSHQLQALLSSGYVLPKCPDSAPSFAEVRTIASRYIRDNRDMFEAYIEEDFDDYCRKIASVSDCVWGGQVELNALTHALQIPIWIYDTVQPVLKMGTEFGTDQDAVVRLSFHRHYYSLGEHYNSVVPC